MLFQKFTFLVLSLSILLISCTDDSYKPVDPAVKPELGELKPVILPNLKHYQMDNGLRVVIVENHEIPVVSAYAVFKAGVVDEPADLEGLARMTAKLMEEGTSSKNSEAFARSTEYYGAKIETYTDYEAISIGLTTLRENLEPSFELFSEMVLSPAFDLDEFDKLRQREISRLKSYSMNPNDQANRLFLKILYGGHPYGHSLAGNENTIPRISLENVKDFYSKYFVTANGLLVFTGDVSTAQAKRLADQYFAKMNKGVENLHDYVTPPNDKPLKIYFVESSQKEQATIRIGLIGIDYYYSELHSSILMNNILGGYSSSRINSYLREEKGWTYGIKTQLVFRQKPGPFFFAGMVSADKADSAIVYVLKQFRDITQNPVSDEEINNAKGYLSGRFALETETAEQIAKKIYILLRYNISPDFFENYRRNIMNVRKSDITDAANHIIKPHHLSVVVVGPPELAKKLKKIAPVSIYSEDLIPRY